MTTGFINRTSRDLTTRKQNGVYYTPKALADFLASWILRDRPMRILEPSVGAGEFLAALQSNLTLGGRSSVLAVDLDSDAVDLAADLVDPDRLSAAFRVEDFFRIEPGTLEPFDAVLGNPPWIRFHLFTGAGRELALQRAAAAGVVLNGLASSWAPFLIHAIQFLGPSGRLAMVLPGEILRVDYAEPVRRYLSDRFRSVEIITFDRPVFPGAQVDAVLLLAGPAGAPGVRISRLRDLQDLGRFADFAQAVTNDRWGEGSSVDIDELLNELHGRGDYVRLGEMGRVDIGVVTGHNKFFILDRRTERRFRIPHRQLRPIVTRSSQLKAGAVTVQSLEHDARRGAATQLLTVDRTDEDVPHDYLAAGRELLVHERYKCRNRKPWYSVPLVEPPQLFLAYMAQTSPRLAVNVAGALSTNLVHGVYLYDVCRAQEIASGWDNLVTALSCELSGRSYGGGVLKLETKEAERVLIPNPSASQKPLSRTEAGLLIMELARRRNTRRRKNSPRS